MKKIIGGLSIVCLLGLLVVIIIQYTSSIYFGVQSFSIDDYNSMYRKIIDIGINSDYIDKLTFSSQEDLKTKVEDIMIDIYGKECVENEKPIQVFYDYQNKIWLLSGSFPYEDPKETRRFVFGGVYNILIDDNTKDVLAIWHDK